MKKITHFHKHFSNRCYVSKKQLLFLITLCITFLGYAQTFTSSDSYGNSIRYTVTSATTVSIMSGSTIVNTNVDIPQSVSNNGTTYSVTAIGIFSFDGTAIASVSIPSTVISIEQQAFSGTNLTSVVLPSNLETIGDYAFQNNQLAGLTIPSSVTNIGIGAFRNNLPLTSVTCLSTIPPSITTANNSSDTFYNGATGDRSNIDLIIPAGTTGVYVTDPGALWTGFNTVTENLNVGDTYVYDYVTYQVISVGNSTVSAVGYDTAGGTIVNIPAAIPNGLITYSVIEIGNNAFSSKGLTSVSIPDSVITIELQAFNANNLTGTLTIPDSVLTIGNGAFAGSSLTEVILGNNLTDIGGGAFIGNNLTDIIIPSSVTNIDSLVFLNNPLTSVTSLAITPPTIDTSGGSDTFAADRSNIALHIPQGTMGAYVTDTGALWTGFNPVTEFGTAQVGDTFVYDFITYEITSLTPNEVKAIDYDMAGGTVVAIPGAVPYNTVSYNVTSIGNQAFQGNGLTNVTISDNVTSIGVYAFFQNAILEVELPSALTNIELGVFENNALNNVEIPDGVTSIGIGAFKNNSLTSITIPSNVTNISIQAFRGNPLSDVFSESLSPPSISTGGSNDSFNSNRGNIHLHIPPGTMGVYVTDPGALWTGFNPVTEDVLGVDDFDFTNSLKVINTEKSLNIITDNGLLLQGYKIYNITGVGVSIGKTSEIPTETLAKGIYILKLDTNRGTFIKKVMIN